MIAAAAASAVSANTEPLWLIFLGTLGGFLVSLCILGLATMPLWKNRREAEQRRRRHEERMEAAADAVLGRDADPNRGQGRVKGLVEEMTDVSSQLRDVKGAVDRMGRGQQIMADRIEDQGAATEQRFAKIEEAHQRDYERLQAEIDNLRAVVGRQH